MLWMPNACASRFGETESLMPNVASPSMSRTWSPASCTAAFTARAASANVLTPEFLENSVQPIPTMAAWERGNCEVIVESSRQSGPEWWRPSRRRRPHRYPS